jgi:hypothetical protein
MAKKFVRALPRTQRECEIIAIAARLKARPEGRKGLIISLINSPEAARHPNIVGSLPLEFALAALRELKAKLEATMPSSSFIGAINDLIARAHARAARRQRLQRAA